MNTEWLPIEINVPDTISSISNGISTATQNIAQQFPWINRIVSQQRPRPFRYFMLVPIRANQRVPTTQQTDEYYDPFGTVANKFPAYP